MIFKKLIPILLTMFFLVGCSDGVNQKATAPQLQEPASATPSVVTAYVGEFYNIHTHEVTAVPYVEPIYAAKGGQIQQLYAYPGKEVNAGEVLLELSQPGLQNRIQNAEAALQRMKDNYANVNTQAELDIQILNVELRQLQSQNADANTIALKQNEITRAHASLRQQEALQALDIQEQENALNELRLQLGNITVCAPFDGQIVSIQCNGTDEITTGGYADAATPVFWIADNSRIALQGSNLEKSYLEKSPSYGLLGDGTYSVRRMSPEDAAIKTSNLSGVGYFEFLDEAGVPIPLQAGQFGLIYVLSEYVENAVLIPSDALLSDENGRYVLVLENGQPIRRDVTVGGISGGKAHITSGIEEGALIYAE